MPHRNSTLLPRNGAVHKAQTPPDRSSPQLRDNRLLVATLGFFIVIAVGRAHEFVGGLATAPVALYTLLLAIGLYVTSRSTAVSQILTSNIVRALIAVALIAAFSVFWSIWKFKTYNALQDILLPSAIAVFLLAKSIATFQAMRFYCACLWASAILITANTLATPWSGRLSATLFYDPNDIAVVLVMALPIAYFWPFKTKKFGTAMKVASIASLTVAILLTQSRGGFVAYVVVMALALSSQYDHQAGRWRLKVRAAYMSTMIALIVALAIFLIPSSSLERLGTIVDLSGDYNLSDDRGRMAIWGRLIGVLFQQPYGTGFFTIDIADGMAGGSYITAHNAFLQVAVELGFIGLVAYVIAIAICFKRLRKFSCEPAPDSAEDYRDTQFLAYGLLLGLTGFCVGAMFLSIAYFWPIVVFIAIIAGFDAKTTRDVYNS